ncbi:hypothetical protein C1645_773884 [Glomus cerebriforme]|uniref:Uncharacterized protein n=1 Tax=Glomus cerebriforme TaxID=658196 RepID=A0A397T0X8_9GLOM|nr:hypothetical protein C1645_773884 [Glomus cerebriforme]
MWSIILQASYLGNFIRCLQKLKDYKNRRTSFSHNSKTIDFINKKSVSSRRNKNCWNI